MTFFGIIISAAVVYVLSTRNRLAYLKKRIDRCNEVINSYLKSRYNLIPRIIEVTSKYIKYDENTLNKFKTLSSSFDSANEMGRDVIENEFKKIMNSLEPYQELKIDIDYLRLLSDLNRIEGQISASRKLYIMDITDFNNLRDSTPANVVATIFKYKQIPVEDDKKTSTPNLMAKEEPKVTEQKEVAVEAPVQNTQTVTQPTTQDNNIQ